MPARETVELAFRAQLGDLRKELAKLPGITEKEAKGMVTALGQQLARAEKAAKRAAQESGSAWDAAGDGLDGVKNIAEGLGGTFGSTAGTAEKFLQSLTKIGGAAGPIPAAIGAGTLAIGAWATGLYSAS